MIDVQGVKYTLESENELTFSISSKGIHGIFCNNDIERAMLTDILAGAREAICGNVLVGKEMADTLASEYRAKIGCALFDAPFYNDATVEEILDFVGRAKRVEPDKLYRQIKEALSFVGIEAIAKKQIGKISAQSKARVSIAQALLGNPDILIFEEPVAFFDENSKGEILEFIKMLGKMKTVIIISADQNLIRNVCVSVLVIKEGCLMFEGAASDMPTYSAPVENVAEISQATEITDEASDEIQAEVNGEEE